ncbi:MAG: RNB domain-containing ribonuclease [Cyanobacteriota bacterium]
MSFREGLIVEFKDKKKVTTVVCIKVEAKNIRVVSDSNKEFNLPINKVGHITSKVLNTSKSRYELIEDIRQYILKAEEDVEEIDLSSLWDLLKDEEDQKYDISQLTDLYFSEAENTYKRSAIFRALIEDNTYFDQKTEGFYSPKEEKIVQQILQQKKIEEEKEKQKKLTLEWLKNIINGNLDSPKPVGADKILETIIDSAVLDTRAEKYSDIVSLMSEINPNIPNIQEFLINLLVRTGIFEEDENLLLREYNIPSNFSKAILDETEKITISVDSELNFRRDLRDLYTVTIDDEETKDIDDGVSVEILDSCTNLYIHIADAANFIDKNSLLNKEAFSRATTIYLPDRKIEMFPQKLSEDVFSLVEGADRFALTILVKFDNNNDIFEYEIFESIINVNKRLSYNEADQIYIQDGGLAKIFQITEKLKQKRIDDGAIILNFPELRLKVDENKKISIGKYKNNSPTQGIISEVMILANYVVAEYSNKNKIPCIYRSQEEPIETIDFDPDANDIVNMFKQRRLMKKSEVSTIPNIHHGLGIKFYCQITSPIRRYSDLVIHRQIKSFLRNGKPFYSEAEIKEVINFTEHSLSVSNIIQRGTIRYWLCKYLLNFVGHKTKALILDLNDDKYIVHLSEIVTELPVNKDFGMKLESTQEIEVIIKDIYIRKGIIIIRILKNTNDEIPWLVV